MKQSRSQNRTVIAYLSSVMLFVVLVFMVFSALTTTASAAVPTQQQPASPSALPPPPPGSTPPSGPLPAATPTAIATVPPAATPDPIATIPSAPPPVSSPVVPSATAVPQGEAARLSVVLLPQPNLTAAPGTIITLDLVITNRGRGTAQRARVDLPLKGLPLTLLEARTSDTQTWVSAQNAEGVTIRTGGISAMSQPITTTLRFQVAANAPIGAVLGTRAVLTWSDRVRGGDAMSNLPILTVGAENRSAETYRFDSDPEGAVMRSALFAPGEPVAVWYQPTGAAPIAAGTLVADANGAVEIVLPNEDVPSGAYQLVAFGLWTEFTVVASVQIP